MANDATSHGTSVPAPSSAANELISNRAVAKAANVSLRTVSTWVREKRIPVVRLSPRLNRFHLPSVLAALRKFEVKEVC
jgi:transposase